MKVDLPEVVFGWNYGVQQEHSVLEMTALHEVQKSVIKTDTLDGLKSAGPDLLIPWS